MPFYKPFFVLLSNLLLVSIFSSPFVNAETLKILSDDHEALQARADIIQQARDEIRAEYFYFGHDETSYALLALFREAAARGVKVKLMLDASFEKVPKAMLAALVEDPALNNRFKIRLFNPKEIPQPSTLIHRDHDKELNIDGKMFIAGGR